MSNLIADMNIKDDFVLGFIKNDNNLFHLPVNSSRPIIMVGSGSGIAPFRGFWQQRYRDFENGKDVGQTILYFGCRKQSMNLFEDEINDIRNNRSVLQFLIL